MKSFDDLQAFVRDNPAESAYLDFKRSEALLGWTSQKIEEMAKDVSAFANSGGGTIIYGADEMREKDDPPRFARFDDGVSGIQVEAVENVLNSEKYIYRRIEDLRIYPISKDEKTLYLVIEIPRSARAPHMHNPSRKYYKRHNFLSEAMLGYEVEDVRNRRVAPSLDVLVERKLLSSGNAGDIHQYRTSFSLFNSGTMSIKNFFFQLFIPPFFRRCLQGQIPGSEEKLDGKSYLVFSKQVLESQTVLFPGQRLTVLSLDYIFDQTSFDEVERPGALPVAYRVFLDDSPPILGSIEWSKLENY